MNLMSRYNASQVSTNAISDASKKTDKYEAKISKQGSVLTNQVATLNTPTNLAPVKNITDYTQQVFQEAVK